jgi:predicted nucleotidyltransferase
MAAEGQRAPSLDDIRQAVARTCEGRGVARVDLFGSAVVAGSEGGRDIDLLIEFKTATRPGLFEMGEIQDDLEQLLGRKVDLVSRRAVERSSNRFRRESILRNTIPVYAG